jgi:hypothetical protein
LQEDGQRDQRFTGSTAARLKTPFYFNELSGHVNGKICPPSRSLQEQPYLKAAESSMDLLPWQNDQ